MGTTFFFSFLASASAHVAFMWAAHEIKRVAGTGGRGRLRPRGLVIIDTRGLGRGRIEREEPDRTSASVWCLPEGAAAYQAWCEEHAAHLPYTTVRQWYSADVLTRSSLSSPDPRRCMTSTSEHKRRRQREREWRSSLTTRVERWNEKKTLDRTCGAKQAVILITPFKGYWNTRAPFSHRMQDVRRQRAGSQPNSPNTLAIGARTIFADAACAMGCRETLASWGAGQRKLIHGWQSGGGQILLSGVLKCLDQLRGEDVDGVEHGWQTSGLWFIRALVLQRSAQAAEIRNGVILEGGGLVDGKNGRKRRRPTCPDPNAERSRTTPPFGRLSESSLILGAPSGPWATYFGAALDPGTRWWRRGVVAKHIGIPTIGKSDNWTSSSLFLLHTTDDYIGLLLRRASRTNREMKNIYSQRAQILAEHGIGFSRSLRLARESSAFRVGRPQAISSGLQAYRGLALLQVLHPPPLEAKKTLRSFWVGHEATTLVCVVRHGTQRSAESVVAGIFALAFSILRCTLVVLVCSTTYSFNYVRTTTQPPRDSSGSKAAPFVIHPPRPLTFGSTTHGISWLEGRDGCKAGDPGGVAGGPETAGDDPFSSPCAYPSRIRWYRGRLLLPLEGRGFQSIHLASYVPFPPIM
ncbi:hypothetical protein B0H14DRAFT_2566092 [Mycena olivaceomarginata]|nr:hypothetical protein B0H14DRAFT_2566092 [Mycena olivaceomarginata]